MNRKFKPIKKLLAVALISTSILAACTTPEHCDTPDMNGKYPPTRTPTKTYTPSVTPTKTPTKGPTPAQRKCYWNWQSQTCTLTIDRPFFCYYDGLDPKRPTGEAPGNYNCVCVKDGRTLTGGVWECFDKRFNQK